MVHLKVTRGFAGPRQARLPHRTLKHSHSDGRCTILPKHRGSPIQILIGSMYLRSNRMHLDNEILQKSDRRGLSTLLHNVLRLLTS